MCASEQGPPDFRERKRISARRDISRVAMDLFVEHGFENTTIEQVASAAGISPRSLFRYFATKEDLVVGHLADEGRQLQAALTARPSDEGPWEAIRAALDARVRSYAATPEQLIRTARMLQEAPALRARHLEKQLEWQELLVPVIADRLADPGETSTIRATAIVATALACLDVAVGAWAADTSVPIADLLDEVIRAVREPDGVGHRRGTTASEG